ncbi:hypothetical protein JF110_001644 [Campylobacter jejuni]|nr:hypothetical protein [Campylobacter jejuni]
MIRSVIFVVILSSAISLFWYYRYLNERISSLETANFIASNEVTKLKNIISEQNKNILNLKADVTKANESLANTDFYTKYEIKDANISKCEDIIKTKLEVYFEKSNIFNNK